MQANKQDISESTVIKEKTDPQWPELDKFVALSWTQIRRRKESESVIGQGFSPGPLCCCWGCGSGWGRGTCHLGWVPALASLWRLGKLLAASSQVPTSQWLEPWGFIFLMTSLVRRKWLVWVQVQHLQLSWPSLHGHNGSYPSSVACVLEWQSKRQKQATAALP